jgi:hypothetical protein
MFVIIWKRRRLELSKNLGKNKKKFSDEFWVGVIGVIGILLLIGIFWSIGLFFEYFKYKAYIEVTHKDMSFWTYHMVKDHLRMIK